MVRGAAARFGGGARRLDPTARPKLATGETATRHVEAAIAADPGNLCGSLAARLRRRKRGFAGVALSYGRSGTSRTARLGAYRPSPQFNREDGSASDSRQQGRRN